MDTVLLIHSRNRAFSWLYGSDHHHEIKHSWPAHFKRRAEQHGYAAAGIVNLSEIQNKLQPDSNAWPCEVNNNVCISIICMNPP